MQINSEKFNVEFSEPVINTLGVERIAALQKQIMSFRGGSPAIDLVKAALGPQQTTVNFSDRNWIWTLTDEGQEAVQDDLGDIARPPGGQILARGAGEEERRVPTTLHVMVSGRGVSLAWDTRGDWRRVGGLIDYLTSQLSLAAPKFVTKTRKLPRGRV